MIHLPTATGGRVTFTGQPGRVVGQGELLARIAPEPPDDGPVEELVAPFDAIVAVQRLGAELAPRHARIVGLRRVVRASMEGRVRWQAELGPVNADSCVALLVSRSGEVLRAQRAGAVGWIGEVFTRAGRMVQPGDALLEIRGEELG